jgi:hypothetical protein
MPQIFDIENAQDLFDLVENRFQRYCDSTEKSTDDILSIIMMINAPQKNVCGSDSIKPPTAETLWRKSAAGARRRR